MTRIVNVSDVKLNIGDNVVVGRYGTIATTVLPAQLFAGATGNATHLNARIASVIGPVHGTSIEAGASGFAVAGGIVAALKVNPSDTIDIGTFLKLDTVVAGAAILSTTTGNGENFAVALELRETADLAGTIRAFVLPWNI